MQLKDRVAIITGGGRGIGRLTALRFAREGAKLMLAARTQSQIDSVVDEVKALGATAVAFQTDVTSEAQVQAMVARTIEELGAIDIMVNNAAGSGEQMELLDMPMEKWDYTLSATLRSTVMCSKYALQHMVPRRSGTVINNASRAGRIGLPGRTDYSPAKAGVIRFTHALARETAAHNIRVNCVVPGAIDTESLRGYFRWLGEKRGTSYEHERANYMEHAGTMKIPVAEEVAEVMLFLASDASSGIHGQCIDVNGGSWMS